MVMRLLKLLGKLAHKLPKLSSSEWDNIFEFLDYYMVVKEEHTPDFTSFEWNKVKEILILMDKVD